MTQSQPRMSSKVLQLRQFPKIQKKIGPSFAQCWFCLRLYKDYFYEGSVSMLELILLCHQKYFGFRVGSLVTCVSTVVEKNWTPSPKSSVFCLRCFVFIGGCFESLSEPLSIHILLLWRGFCEMVR